MVYMWSVLHEAKLGRVSPGRWEQTNPRWRGGIHTGTCCWLLEGLAVSIKLVSNGYLWGTLGAMLGMGRVEKTNRIDHAFAVCLFLNHDLPSKRISNGMFRGSQTGKLSVF